MKIVRAFIGALFMLFLCISSSFSQDIEPYIGRWALNLQAGAGWIEITQQKGYLEGSYMWVSGSVLPADYVYWDGKNMIMTRSWEVVREKDASGKTLKSQKISCSIELNVKGDKLTGRSIKPSITGKNLEVEEFTGKRISDVPAAPDLAKIKFGSPVQLFNGKDLTGWSLKESGAKSGWSVENGEMCNDPAQPETGSHIIYGNLRTDKTFNDFNLKLEVNVPVGSNSGIYLKGIYEIQVVDSYGKSLDSHNMGAVYSRITPSASAEKPAGEWQLFDITLCKRHITVILNGVKIIDNQPVYGITGGAITSDEMSAGPLYLQGDHGKVKYRNFVLTPITE
jgi:hypothetical protein